MGLYGVGLHGVGLYRVGLYGVGQGWVEEMGVTHQTQHPFNLPQVLFHLGLCRLHPAELLEEILGEGHSLEGERRWETP